MRLVLLIGAVLMLGACGAAPAPSASATPTATAEQLALLTQPPAPPNQACMDALAVGNLALHPRSGLGITGEGEAIAVAWPNGYTARLIEGTLVLYDHQGNALARLGDRVELGGGFGPDGLWYPCHGSLTVGRP